MTQDRRKDENRPTEVLVFTDAALITAGLAHLEAERAGACLVHAKDDVWVGVGTKCALRGLLSDDTASQSQAVPSELASVAIVGYRIDYANGRRSSLYSHEIVANGIAENNDGTVEPLVKLSDVQSLFSHSAATGKVPEAYTKAMRDIIRVLRGVECGDDSQWKFIASVCENAEELLASPAAPLAGKAEPTKDTPESMANSNARFAIDGAIQYGRENRNQPPSKDHWLYEYWNIGRQLNEAGRTGWDNVTPLALAEPAPIHASAEVVRAGPSDESQAREWLASHGYSSLTCALADLQSRIDAKDAELRDLVVRLSTPTAPVAADAAVTAQSIDTPEFRKLMELMAAQFHRTEIWCHDLPSWPSLVEFIDRHIAAHAPAGRDAQPFKLPNGWKIDKGGDDYRLRDKTGLWCGYITTHESPAHRLTRDFLADLWEAMQPAAPHAAEQTSGVDHA